MGTGKRLGGWPPFLHQPGQTLGVVAPRDARKRRPSPPLPSMHSHALEIILVEVECHLLRARSGGGGGGGGGCALWFSLQRNSSWFVFFVLNVLLPTVLFESRTVAWASCLSRPSWPSLSTSSCKGYLRAVPHSAVQAAVQPFLLAAVFRCTRHCTAMFPLLTHHHRRPPPPGSPSPPAPSPRTA